MSDVPAAHGVLDTLGMFEVTAGLPEQVAAAVGAAHGLDGLPEREYVENVVVLGMGGSGLAGDVMVAVAGPFVPVPITVVKSYDLPDFVGRGSLVFAISFSGNTEETVEAAGEAANAGASLVAVTAGGELGRLADEWGAPVVAVPTDHPPAPGRARGHGHPARSWSWRTSGSSPARPPGWPWPWTSSSTAATGSSSPGAPAEEVARRIGRTIPLVHGAQAVGAAAALAVEGPGQRERQVTGLRGGLPRAVPQRDRRLGPARRRHPPGPHAGQPAPRRRASPAGPALRLRRRMCFGRS